MTNNKVKEKIKEKLHWNYCPKCWASSITQRADSTQPYRRWFWVCRFCGWKKENKDVIK